MQGIWRDLERTWGDLEPIWMGSGVIWRGSGSIWKGSGRDPRMDPGGESGQDLGRIWGGFGQGSGI